MSKAKTDGIKLIANNKKARHDYFVEDSFEAGIVLHGTEVKSLRQGHCSIKESFVDIDNGEVFIHQMHISPYEKGNIFNKDPPEGIEFTEGNIVYLVFCFAVAEEKDYLKLFQEIIALGKTQKKMKDILQQKNVVSLYHSLVF